jgi:hypothetical protein
VDHPRFIELREEEVLEAIKVVADVVEGAKPLDEARCDLLAESRWGSRLELHSGRYHMLPHGGRYNGILRTVAIGLAY